MGKAKNISLIYPVILAGGKGSRLWPISRFLFPKQLHSLYSNYSMLQDTILRVNEQDIFKAPTIIANKEHRFIILDQIKHLNLRARTILLEPEGKNTAPAIVSAATEIAKEDPDAIILVLPSDHVIEENKNFVEAVKQGIEAAKTGHIVTFGIAPTAPKTGYGYIRRGKKISGLSYRIDAFVEKPNKKKAVGYISTGKYYWNSGMFLFKAKTFLAEAKRIQPELHKYSKKSFEKGEKDQEFFWLNKDEFAQAPAISIDYAIMESTKKAAVVELDAKWNDLGVWSELWQIRNKDGDNNVLIGNVTTVDTKNSYVLSRGPLVGTVGIDDLVVVAMDDAVLVSSKNEAQKVSQLVDLLKLENKQEYFSHPRVYRPWGFYRTMSSKKGYLVKEIHVEPGKKLSLQKHEHRAEHWVVVSGKAKITRDKESLILTKDQSTYIPKGVVHRLENATNVPLVLIEIQTGGYIGEDDISRFDDDYGRKKKYR